MRSNQSLADSGNGRVANKLSVSGMPLEWLDAGSWRLPSGKALAEFALQAGFLAPLLLRSKRLMDLRTETASRLSETKELSGSKDFEKGESQ